jgi:hypothetical protein
VVWRLVQAGGGVLALGLGAAAVTARTGLARWVAGVGAAAKTGGSRVPQKRSKKEKKRKDKKKKEKKKKSKKSKSKRKHESDEEESEVSFTSNQV